MSTELAYSKSLKKHFLAIEISLCLFSLLLLRYLRKKSIIFFFTISVLKLSDFVFVLKVTPAKAKWLSLYEVLLTVADSSSVVFKVTTLKVQHVTHLTNDPRVSRFFYRQAVDRSLCATSFE